jgi:hypothetical protein
LGEALMHFLRWTSWWTETEA